MVIYNKKSKEKQKKAVHLWLVVVFSAWLLAACGESTVTPSPTALPPTPTLPPSTSTPLPPPTAIATATATPVAIAPTPKPTAGPLKTVGDLPPPEQARALSFSLETVQKAKNRLAPNLKVDFSKLQLGAFALEAENRQPADIFDFYRQTMSNKGWKESTVYDKRLGIYFVKDGQVAVVAATGVPDEQTVIFLATLVPEMRGQLKGSEILVLLGQGSQEVFEVLKRNK